MKSFLYVLKFHLNVQSKHQQVYCQLVLGFKHLQDVYIVFADEAFFVGHHQHAATLKTLITGEQIFIEPKGVDGFMAPKIFRMITLNKIL